MDNLCVDLIAVINYKNLVCKIRLSKKIEIKNNLIYHQSSFHQYV